MIRLWLWWLVALLACNGGLMSRANAQDSQGVYGTRYGCVVVTAATGSWGELTSDDLYDTATGSALAAGLYLAEVSVVSRETAGTGDTAVLCVGASAGCGATTHAPQIAAGGARVWSTRGLVAGGVTAQAVSLRSTGSGTASLEVCAIYRTQP